MLYDVRLARPTLLLALGFTARSNVAAMVWGWHYPWGVFAGAALAAVARWQSAHLLPHGLVT